MDILFFIKRLSSLRRLKCTSIIGKWNIGTLKYVLTERFFSYCVLYQRFNCKASWPGQKQEFRVLQVMYCMFKSCNWDRKSLFLLQITLESGST